jgi:hypothetical protein
MFDFHSVVAAQESICGHRGVQARLSARGWFSDRTTRYLASGRTSVVQETGFTDHIRVGEGLLTFSTMDEAVSAVKAIEANYEAHTDAARDLAERYSSATSCSSAADSMRTSRVPHNRGARRRAQRPRDDHDPFQGSRWTVGPGEPLRRRESGREIDLYKSVLSRLQLGTAAYSRLDRRARPRRVLVVPGASRWSAALAVRRSRALAAAARWTARLHATTARLGDARLPRRDDPMYRARHRLTGGRRSLLLETYLAELPRDPGQDQVELLECCRLCLAVKWLGLSKTWTPPPEHARDRAALALAAAARLESAT